MFRRIVYLVLVTVILGGLAGGIAYYSFAFKPKMLAEIIGKAPQPAEQISAQPVKTDSWQPQIIAVGTLTAVDGINVTPQVGGVVKEIGFESGGNVKQGSLLVKLDTQTDEADIRSTEAELANAQRELDRNLTLVKRGVVARSGVDSLRTQVATLTATAERLKAVIEQKSILAPWDGKLGLREVSVGSYVAPGQPLVWLQKLDPIYVDFAVTEADYGRVKMGQKLMVRFNAFPDQTFAGEIISTSGRMSDVSRLLTVRGRLPNGDGKLLPGMYANVTVNAGEPEQVLTVPQTAVLYSLYGDNAFVVVPAKKLNAQAKDDELAVERRFIKVGDVRDGQVRILEGLKPDEKVVSAGQNKIDQGSKVVINNDISLQVQDAAQQQ